MFPYHLHAVKLITQTSATPLGIYFLAMYRTATTTVITQAVE